MPIPLKTRLLEWFADSSTQVQYPQPRRATEPPPVTRLAWTNSMSLGKRIFMVLIGLFALCLGGLLLAVLLTVVWAFIPSS
jgi:hypothetical protein